MFPGQGGQWSGMGRDLAAASPVFAARLAECGRALAPYLDWSPEEVMAGAAGAPQLDRTDVVQPVLWAVMVSLAAAWQAAGVTPDAVVGHSQGEIAAACVAGILSLEDAARIVALRSRALLALAGRGGMMSVAEPAAAVRDRIAGWGDRLSVAAVNGPAATVVSGEPAALEAAGRRLRGRRDPDQAGAGGLRLAQRAGRAAPRGDPGGPGRDHPGPGPHPDDLRDDRASRWTGREPDAGVLVRQPARAGGVRPGGAGAGRPAGTGRSSRCPRTRC